MNKFEAIVVGGGYPGCSIAYHLSKAGVKTLLLEKKEISSGASGGNFGCIQVQDASLGLSLDLTMRSFPRVMNYEQELQTDLELTSVGSLIAAVNEAEMQELDTLYRGKIEGGLDIHMYGPKQLKKAEPNMNVDKFLGATYFKQGRLNPFKLMYAFLRKGREYGLSVQEQTRVKELYMEGGKVKGVTLTSGKTIFAQQVIIAAGAWTKELCKTAGLLVPIEYVRAEGFVSEKLKPFLNNYYSSASFFTEAHDVDGVGMSLCMGQTQSGNLLIGETSKPGNVLPDDASRRSSYEHFIKTKEALSEYFPALKDMNLLRAWSTVSPYTDTMEPVLGQVGPEGLLVAAGFKSCVIMTAVVGDIMTDLVTKGDTFCDLSGFNAQVRPL
ncbi:FAD-binding oxidoreductase [Clostridia bacterium]|nr:FAD-binding oxidoreductase [Clostridia bacterium]